MRIDNIKKLYRDHSLKVLIFGGGLIIAILLGLLLTKIDDVKADFLYESEINANSNIFGLTSETITIEYKNLGVLNEVAYLFNMQEGETSVITNDNEVFFIKEVLNNESVYIVLIKTPEGVMTILLDNEWIDQEEDIKNHVKEQIEELKNKILDK